jgi:hypothetical protein
MSNTKKAAAARERVLKELSWLTGDSKDKVVEILNELVKDISQ